MDALYFRVSSDRQTTENQFDELIAAARASDPAREWDRIRSELGRAIVAEIRTTRRGATRTVYQVAEEIARRLADQCIYVEQGKLDSSLNRQMYSQGKPMIMRGLTTHTPRPLSDPYCRRLT